MSNARELDTGDVADLLGYDAEDKWRRRKARRWLQQLGIARQHVDGGRVYTTLPDLREHAAHVWAEAVTRE